MPTIRSPRRIPDPRRARRLPAGPSIVVVGDLVLDVVLAPGIDLERGTDVPGRVRLRQGGSATTTARWLGRLGSRSSLVCAVGRDAIGRSLVAVVAGDGVQVRAVRVAGAPTGRIGVLVEPDGERSFIQDRGAALRLRPEDLKTEWFAGADAVHLPAYSLLDQPLGLAGMAATRLARGAGALVTVDLSSTAPRRPFSAAPWRATARPCATCRLLLQSYRWADRATGASPLEMPRTPRTLRR